MMTTKTIRRIAASAIATGALLANAMMAPVFAATDLEISGNGAFSTSTANVSQTSNTTVNQTNTANIQNNITTNSTTGNNVANNNTGGDVTVSTGNASSAVTVDNTANSNQAVVGDVGGTSSSANVLISGNGTGTNNTANVTTNDNTRLTQTNNATINNRVNVSANSGNNRANNNTGGDVTVSTGGTDATVDIANTANSNRAYVGNTGGAGTLSARIIGNGSFSRNAVTLTDNSTQRLTQTNNARINNDVRINSNTGRNDANNNTGGDVLVSTGDARSDVAIDNAVNFNEADLDGVSIGDVDAVISGNGTGSLNRILARLGDNVTVDQRNNGTFNNNVRDDAITGNNRANNNTGLVGGGSLFSVLTGGTSSDVSVSTTANSNHFGTGTGLGAFTGLNLSGLQDLLGRLSLDVNISGLLGTLLGYLH